ncbi:anti-sigma factor [Mycolicibacterium conceptionense]|uniref:anti-sigma factor n=1 Tax=Mycolicibacterium conceptionense TaxID=451644 RepID=UPI0007EDE65A|nr:anti-sigma factor [Mycolicibacterium conceptionense]OBJ96809.1 anti-sigma factor [Mycolicibacterium conceptionense]OMB77886.1 anti-sigma factor [Mycolicibacterium conceptionense]OMB78368.1 anti-sigma factor [Mycolicibacterium conceptionense]
MTADSELPDLATAYALDAVSDAERADIERRLAEAPTEIAVAFRAEVRAVREAMANASWATEVAPPATLRQRSLAISREPHPDRFRWRKGLLAAAAAVVVAAAGFGAGLALRPVTEPTTAEQVLTAGDVRTATGQLSAGGTATFVYSRDQRTGVLVMNNAAPAPPGMVYQMWLMTDQGPESAGTVGAVAPSTTAMVRDLGDSSALAFTMEPDGGSSRPTGEMVARLSLT